MRNLTAHLPNGETVTYRDRKRWLWLNSVLYPLFPFAGIAAHAATGVEAWLVLPLVFAYGVAPLMDWLIGEDQSNPPEAVVPQLEKDQWSRHQYWS